MMKGALFIFLALSQVLDITAFVPQVPPATADKCSIQSTTPSSTSSNTALNYGGAALDYPVRYNGNGGGPIMDDYGGGGGYGGYGYGGGYGRGSVNRGSYRNHYDSYYGAQAKLNSGGAYSLDYTTQDGRMPAYGSNSYNNRYNQGYGYGGGYGSYGGYGNYNRSYGGGRRGGGYDMYDRDYSMGGGYGYGRRNNGYGMYNSYDYNSPYGNRGGSYGRSYGYGNGSYYNGGYGRRNSYYGRGGGGGGYYNQGMNGDYGMGVGGRRSMNGEYRNGYYPGNRMWRTDFRDYTFDMD